MKTLLIVITTFMLFTSNSFALKWSSTYGGAQDDGTASDTGKIIETADGGFLIGGETSSFGSGSFDIWLIKTNANGLVQWEKTYGGTQAEGFRSVRQTTDNGFIVLGSTQSAGSFATLILKLDQAGNIQWQNTYGPATGAIDAFTVAETNDGNYVVTGFSDAVDPFGDPIIFKLDSQGNVLWAKNYDDPPTDPNTNLNISIEQTSDSGYITSGFIIVGGTNRDAVIAKLDNSGEPQWVTLFRGSGQEIFNCAIEMSDGTFVALGSTDSFGSGNRDLLIMKLNSNGNVISQYVFGGTGDDRPLGCDHAPGGIVVGGFSTSSGFGNRDIWLMKFDEDLNVLWEQSFGGSGFDLAAAIISTVDGGYAVSGVSGSVTTSKELIAMTLDSNGETNSSCLLSNSGGATRVVSAFPESAISVPTTLLTIAPNTTSLLAGDSGATISCTPGSGTGSLSVSNASAVESDDAVSVFATSPETTATFRLKLSGPSSSEVTASYRTVDGSAVAGIDYEPLNGSITFEPGELIKTIEVPIVGDLTKETKEKFMLTVFDVNGATVAKAVGTATIVDDDK